MLDLPASPARTDVVLPQDHNTRLPHQPPWAGPGRYTIWMRNGLQPGMTLAFTLCLTDPGTYDVNCEKMRFSIWSQWVAMPLFDPRTTRWEFIPKEQLC